MSTFDAIDRAAGREEVILADAGSSSSGGRTTRVYHRQPYEDAMQPACGNFGGDGVIVPRDHAEGLGYEACDHCDWEDTR